MKHQFGSDIRAKVFLDFSHEQIFVAGAYVPGNGSCFFITSRGRTLWRPRGSSRDPQTPINDRLSCFGQRYGCFCSH